MLEWMVGLSSVFSLAHHLKVRDGRGWLLLHSGLLLGLGLGLWLRFPWTGYVLGGLWLTLAALPTFGVRRAVELVSKRRLAEAARWARLSSWLHPLDGLPAQARFVRATERAQAGDLSTALELLHALHTEPRFAELARVTQWQLQGDWTRIVDHVDAQPVGTRDIRLAAIYLHALGETGDVSGMLLLFARLPLALTSDPLLRAKVAAYAGQSELLNSVVTQAQPGVPAALHTYLRAVSLQVAGSRQAARELLDELQHSKAIGNFALRRLRRPLEPLDPTALSPQANRALERLEREVRWEQHHPPAKPRRPLTTWALMTCLVAVFLVSARGGSTNVENLYRMGALRLPLESPHERWRIVTAGFLHYGATHLALNLFALWLLGRAVEQWWGRASVLISFFAGSIGAFWLAAVTSDTSSGGVHVLLGASAGVFGLVGALLAFDLVGVLFKRTQLVNSRLIVLLFLLLAQALFDFFTPIVSSLLHFAGAGFGALAALPLAIWRWRSVHRAS